MRLRLGASAAGSGGVASDGMSATEASEAESREGGAEVRTLPVDVSSD